MSPIIKKLIVIVFGSTRRFIVGFGGMAVMVVTTSCGWMIGFDTDNLGGLRLLAGGLEGGAIGAVVGGLLWGLLGYMVCRVKKPAELPPGPPSS